MEKGYASLGLSYAQVYPKDNLLDICIMDDGLSIPKKFEENGISFVNDCDAISKATFNVSTTGDEDRGHGLWTTLKLIVEGNGGNALIVSRNGCLHITSKNTYNYRELDNNIFKGTLIALRIKPNIVQDFYKYIDISSLNHKYEYKRDG